MRALPFAFLQRTSSCLKKLSRVAQPCRPTISGPSSIIRSIFSSVAKVSPAAVLASSLAYPVSMWYAPYSGSTIRAVETGRPISSRISRTVQPFPMGTWISRKGSSSFGSLDGSPGKIGAAGFRQFKCTMSQPKAAHTSTLDTY